MWWLKDLGLFKDDKEILEGVSWLNDNIIQAVQDLLKQETDLDGFQSPLCGINNHFRIVNLRSGYVQILNVNNNHWVTVSNTVNDIVRQNDVYVYDSLLPNKVDLSVIKQVCSLVKTPSERLYFNIVDVMRQRNSFDCGLHALATAVDIVFKRDPARSHWDLSSMRAHLVLCLERRKIYPFPTTSERPIRFGRRIKFYKEIDVHCCCRMPYDSKELDGMIQCQMCKVWFHGRCVSTNIEEYKHRSWLCNKCNALLNN